MKKNIFIQATLFAIFSFGNVSAMHRRSSTSIGPREHLPEGKKNIAHRRSSSLIGARKPGNMFLKSSVRRLSAAVDSRIPPVVLAMSTQDACRYAHACLLGAKDIPKDPARAFELYCVAAARRSEGSDLAWNNLGILYELGAGTERNLENAVLCYKEAIKLKADPFARFNLALCYAYGKSVSADPKKAFPFFYEAGMQGHMKAAFAVALCYLCGVGTPRDFERGQNWLKMIGGNSEKSRMSRAHRTIAAVLSGTKFCLVCPPPQTPSFDLLKALLALKDVKKLSALDVWLKANSCPYCLGTFESI